MSRPAPTPRGAFPLFEPVQMRWADTDIYGHMNNAVHYLLFDTAVQRFLVREGLLDLQASPTVFLVVASGCDYFDEITFADTLEAGLRITRLGQSSVTYQIGIFKAGGEYSAATGHFTHVNVDRATRRPVPLTQGARHVFERLTS